MLHSVCAVYFSVHLYCFGTNYMLYMLYMTSNKFIVSFCTQFPKFEGILLNNKASLWCSLTLMQKCGKYRQQMIKKIFIISWLLEKPILVFSRLMCCSLHHINLKKPLQLSERQNYSVVAAKPEVSKHTEDNYNWMLFNLTPLIVFKKFRKFAEWHLHIYSKIN